MPNRVIREGFLDSAKINSLTDQEQLFYVRLLLVVDDYGRYDARPELIKSRCYPVTDKRQAIVSTMLTKLNKVGLLVLYSVNDKNYLEICNYNQRLRQKREKYPAPNNGIAVECLSDVSMSRPESNPIQFVLESEKNLNPNQNPKVLSDFDIALNDFYEMRKKIKKPMTDRAKELLIIELKKLAPNNQEEQIEILNKSTVNDWQGVFLLKKDKKKVGII